MDQAILAARSPEEIAEAAVKHIRKLIPSLGAGIAKFDFSVGTAILLATNVSLRDWLRPGLKVPLAGVEPLIAELRQGAINQVDDLQAMPSPLPEALQLLQAVGVRSYIAIPLMIQDTLMGALCIGAQEPAAFSEEHIEVASEIANSLAIALHQKQLFQEVQRQRRQVRALAAQIDQIEQAERRRLAHELHDQIGQNLTALSIHLSTIRTILSPETAHRALPRLDDAITLVEEIAQRIRDVMAELHPAILDDYGLLPALRWYAENFSQRTGIIAHVRGDDEAPRLPSRVETTLFRIAQEVLTNVAKHAQATRVTITLEMKGEGACLMITDDGVGFDPTTLQKPEQRERWGLRIMRERAEAIGGRLSIHSAPGKGTQVVVEIGTTQT
jgi:signal transduction histidine kinase